MPCLLRVALAVVAVAAWVAEATGAWVEGWWTWEIGLPLELCDVALGLTAAALLTGKPLWIEPLWYVGFAGTLPALFTSDSQPGHPGRWRLARFPRIYPRHRAATGGCGPCPIHRGTQAGADHWPDSSPSSGSSG